MIPRFIRPQGERRYRRMFVIVAEGTVTEPQYFSLLSEESIVKVICLKNTNGLTPEKALNHIEKYVREEGLEEAKGDEAWVVVDRDSWPENHFDALHTWAKKKSNYGFALSNPKFEYWLLLHFEDAKGVTTSKHCDDRLKKHISGYKKHIDSQHYPREKIDAAVTRAKQRDNPPCKDWPRDPPGSTVYKLVEKILESRTNP